MNESPRVTRNGQGRSFRRVRTAAIVAGTVAGALACFAGVAPALASTHTVTPAASPHVASAPSASGTSTVSESAVTSESPKNSADDIDAYYAAGYGVTDSMDLAALWGSPNRNTAKVTAGAKIRAGVSLPFAPGGGYAWTYTPAQQLAGYALSDNQGDKAEALRLAVFWGSPDIKAAETKAGGLLLANQALPIPKVYSSEQYLDAFFLAGYDYADAVKLAQLWNSDSPASAKATAGHDLLSLPGVALPIRP